MLLRQSVFRKRYCSQRPQESDQESKREPTSASVSVELGAATVVSMQRSERKRTSQRLQLQVVRMTIG